MRTLFWIFSETVEIQNCCVCYSTQYFMFVLTTYSATQETDQNNFNISKDVGTDIASPIFAKKCKLKGFEPATFCFLTISFDLF